MKTEHKKWYISRHLVNTIKRYTSLIFSFRNKPLLNFTREKIGSVLQSIHIFLLALKMETLIMYVGTIVCVETHEIWLNQVLI
jgi:hypothetical protein